MNEPDRDYEYDVAFSFLAEDEELAYRLNDLVQDRLNTFIYSKRQEEIIGTDGEQKFHGVFGAQARTVVVLYREKWGKTPWTRIEETAIRNRAYKEGYDFVLFVQLERSARLPEWLPKTQIWADLERWGEQATAAIIEQRAKQAGAASREESAVDRARRIEREAAAEEARRWFLNSEQGVKAANAEVEVLIDDIVTLAEEIGRSTEILRFTKERERGRLILRRTEGSLTIGWQLQRANTLRDSTLFVRIFDGPVSFRERLVSREPEIIEEFQFDFDRTAAGVGWRERDAERRFLSSGQLAESCVNLLLARVRAAKLTE